MAVGAAEAWYWCGVGDLEARGGSCGARETSYRVVAMS